VKRRSPPNMKRRGEAQGTGAEHANPHATGRAASESEIAPATAPVPNGHGTRICRVVTHRESDALPGVTNPRPALHLAVAHSAKADRVSIFGSTRMTRVLNLERDASGGAKCSRTNRMWRDARPEASNLHAWAALTPPAPTARTSPANARPYNRRRHAAGSPQCGARRRPGRQALRDRHRPAHARSRASTRRGRS
jgi:hypothetical protein